MVQMKAEVSVKGERCYVRMDVRIRPNTPILQSDGDKVAGERARSESGSKQSEAALLMLDATSHPADVGAVLLDHLNVGLHMGVLVEVLVVCGEALQNVDAIIHVLHKAMKKRLLGFQQRSILLWQKMNDPRDTIFNQADGGVVGAEGMPEAELTMS